MGRGTLGLDADEKMALIWIQKSADGGQGAAQYRGNAIQPMGDFDWSEIDQSRFVGAETSHVP